VLIPSHGAPHAALVHVSELVLKVGTIVQVEELGGARCVIARGRMGGDIIDLFVADPDDAPVVERLEILLPGSQHAGFPESARHWLCACHWWDARALV
jgi:hypothetical protein